MKDTEKWIKVEYINTAFKISVLERIVLFFIKKRLYTDGESVLYYKIWRNKLYIV